MTLREFITEASEEKKESSLWKKLSKKTSNSEIVDEYEDSPRKYALINKTSGEILEISNSPRISTAGYINSEIEIGDNVVVLNIVSGEEKKVEVKLPRR